MRERVIEALVRLFTDREVNIAALPDDADLGLHLHWDSMDIVDLGLEFQHRLGVRLPDELTELYTISRLVHLLDSESHN